MEFLEGAALLTATVAVGLMAGVFGLYAHTIMPGLGKTNDRTFVGAFQAIDTAIINPWFIPVFFGALLLTGVAGALQIGDDGSALGWIVAAFALYLVVVVSTVRVNVPLNDYIKGQGEPDRIDDLASVRERFNEAKWRRWNLMRTLACTVAFGCLAWALVEFGRTVA
jgi:uncharacterized membrane protein